MMMMMMSDQNLTAFMIAAVSLKCKNKLNLRVKVTLEQGTKGQRGSRGIALLFL